jgi:hypothetical protein
MLYLSVITYQSCDWNSVERVQRRGAEFAEAERFFTAEQAGSREEEKTGKEEWAFISVSW